MKKREKIIGGIVVVIICVALLLFAAYKISLNSNKADNELTSYEQDERLVTKVIPTEFIIYGEELGFDDMIFTSYISSIDSESLYLDTAKYRQAVIILNDLNGRLDITDAEWLLIKKYIDENGNYSLCYLGDGEFERMQELGVTEQLMSLYDGDLSVMIVHSGGEKIYITGTYTVEERDVYHANIPELILCTLTHFFKEDLK